MTNALKAALRNSIRRASAPCGLTISAWTLTGARERAWLTIGNNLPTVPAQTFLRQRGFIETQTEHVAPDEIMIVSWEAPHG